MKKQFQKIILEAVNELGMKISFLSNNFSAIISYHGVDKFIVGNTLPLNNVSVYRIVRNKNICSDILRKYELPIIPHEFLLSPNSRLNRENYEGLQISLAKIKKQYGFPLVVKRNETSGGEGVLFAKNTNELDDCLLKLFSKVNVVSICPFREITNEYRVVVLNGECVLSYEKIRPFVIGDGNSSILSLIQNKYSKFIGEKKVDLIDDTIKNYLFDVPLIGQRIYLQQKHNSFAASTCLEFENDEIKNLALKAVRCIGAEFVSVDIIFSEKIGYEIIEINASVVLNLFSSISAENFSRVKNIFKRAITKTFNLE